MPVSIEDVAKKADVSISTVSRVVNRKSVVNEQTRKRVELAIADLGYRPNVFARGLMLQQSNLLGLILPDMHGEFYSEIIRGANACAQQHDRQLVVSSPEKGTIGGSLLSSVAENGLVDGVVVMISDADAGALETLAATKVPFVTLDGVMKRVRHDAVVIDQRTGTEALMHHLIENCGTERIIFVGGSSTNLDTSERLEAYHEVLAKASIPVRAGDVYHLDYSYQTAFELGLKRVVAWAEDGVCVFSANDEMAAGIVDAAIERGIAVPRDLRVVGFDDTRIAQMTRPRLTTVHAPMAEMGAAAIELLCERISQPDRPPRKITLQSELVVRDSCGTKLARKKTQ